MTDTRLRELVQIERVEGVIVVRFLRRTIFDPLLIELIGSHLLELTDQEPNSRLLINFTNVESLTSAMHGKLVGIYRAIEDEGGQLAFCCVDPFLQQIFHICRLPPEIVIYENEADAVAALRLP